MKLVYRLFIVTAVIGFAGLAVCAVADGYHYAVFGALAALGICGATYPGFHE